MEREVGLSLLMNGVEEWSGCEELVAKFLIEVGDEMVWMRWAWDGEDFMQKRMLSLDCQIVDQRGGRGLWFDRKLVAKKMEVCAAKGGGP